MKTIISFIILVSVSCLSWGAKAQGGIANIRQSDGTCINVIAFGDEDFHYATTTDDVVLYHVGTDYFIANISSNGVLSPTSQLAHEKNLRSSEENKLIAEQNISALYSNYSSIALKARMKREPIRMQSTYFPHTGTPTALVILVEFADTVFSLDQPKVVFNKYLNAKFLTSEDGTVSSNYGSVANYFEDMSFGSFRPKFDVYGPVKLKDSLKVYGLPGKSDNVDKLIPDACNAVKDSVDFSKYDEDGDGYVDLVYIIYAGYSESISHNSTECIWPKSGTISLDTSYNGKKICRYGVNNELIGYPGAFSKPPYKRCNGIGLFCHEFSHCLGLPDLYCTWNSPNIPTLEYWDLMDGGEYCKNGYSPCTYSAWEREALGWMKIDSLTSSQTITLKPIEDGGVAYKIMNDKDAKRNEYYIVENRQKKGWNKSNFGHGMLVYHVDYDANAFSLESNSVNNTLNHPRMTLISADGEVLSYYKIKSTNADGIVITDSMYKADMKGDPFPGIKNTRCLTDTSKYASIVYTGNYLSKPILDIQEDTLGTDDYASITFKFYTSNSIITGIQNPIYNIPEENSDNIYTVDGVMVGSDLTKLKKGIYIRNRRKIVIR